MPIFIYILLLAATASSAPQVISHPPIPLEADASAFARARTGCQGSGTLVCKKGPIADLGCDRITVDDFLGGLALPTAHCWKDFHGQMPPASEYIRGPGGLLPIIERLVVLDHGQYRLIKNMTDYYAAAKPVTSEAQALSTAVAVTATYPVHASKVVPGLRYFVSTLEDTFVTRERDDFIVHNLQYYRVFGCGPHSTYLVTVRVPRVGGVTEISRIKAFEDPKQDGLCVD